MVLQKNMPLRMLLFKKKCETVLLIPLFLLDGMIDIKYVVLSLLINKTFEGLRIPDSNELCI